MAHRPTRSLQHEYERYVEQEIEAYKESVPRSVLLSIGDEAVAALARDEQFTLTELIVWEEVDRIIARRLRLPSATTWRRRRLKAIEELRRPERWGMSAKHPLVQGLKDASEGVALVAGAVDEGPTLYLAANGCRVTAIDDEPDAVDRVMHAATRAGIMDRIDARVGGLETWFPDSPLFAVIVSDAALATLSNEQRRRVLETLQRATIDGGVHLVQALAGPEPGTLEQLREFYHGWSVQVDQASPRSGGFLATKASH